jgi:hypothetical protein
MLKYHLLIPAAVFIVLLAVGVSLVAAIAVGLMIGCMSMMVMTMANMKSRVDGHRDRTNSGAGRT